MTTVELVEREKEKQAALMRKNAQEKQTKLKTQKGEGVLKKIKNKKKNLISVFTSSGRMMFTIKELY